MAERKLVLKLDNKGQGADVFSTFTDDLGDGDAMCLVALYGPDEAADLQRLLSDALDNCATCGQPLWVDTAGECGLRGLYCCSHPDHGPSAECEREAI